jgi:MFS family permease
LAFAGRFVFGLGGESMTVAQNSFTVKWFEGKNLALAFGVVVAFARVGSSINFLITPTLASDGVPFALWFGFGACVFSFFMCILLSGLDKYASAKLPPKPTSEAEASEKEGFDIKLILRQIADIPLPAWILNFICMFFYVGVLTFNTVASQIMQVFGFTFLSLPLPLPPTSFLLLTLLPNTKKGNNKKESEILLLIFFCFFFVFCVKNK